MADPEDKVAAELLKIKEEERLLEKRRAELETQKAELEIYRRVKARLDGDELSSNSFVQALIAHSVPAAYTPRANSTKAQVLSLAEEVVAKEGCATTRDVLKRLDSEGIAVGGKDKLLAVSKILSESNKFKLKNRKEGWTFKDDKTAEPDSAPTESGSFFQPSGSEPDQLP